MTKQTKTLLAIAGVGVIGYFIYKNNRSKANCCGKMNAAGPLPTGVAKFQLTQETLAVFTDRQIPQSFKLKTGDILIVNWRTIVNGIPTGYTTINGREATFPLSAGRFVY